MLYKTFPELLNYNILGLFTLFLCYRYIRDSGKLFLQWKDKRVITMLSTFHRGSDSVNVQRNTKQNGQHVVLQLRQPKAIHDYNHGMGGVDAFDSRSAAYRIRRKSRKYWKALLYDFIEIACVNSYILFEQYRQDHAEEIQRIRTYDHEEFRVFLIRQLGGLAADAPSPHYTINVGSKTNTGRLLQSRITCQGTHQISTTADTVTSTSEWRESARYSAPAVVCTFTSMKRNCYERWHAEKM